MRNIFMRAGGPAQPRDRHEHSRIPRITTPLLGTSAYALEEARSKSPQISTSKAMTQKERELRRQLQEKDNDILSLRASYEDRISRQEHQIQSELHGQITMREKAKNDMLETSSRFQRKLDNKDKEVEQLRGSYQRLLQTHESQQRSSKTFQRDTDAEKKELQEKLEKAKQELDLCQDDLFRMQPVCRASDREIIDAFETLSEQLINWIDHEISVSERANPGAHIGHPFSGSRHSFVALFLCTYPSAGEHLCRYMVNRMLLESIFGPKMRQLGLSVEQASVMWSIECGMAALKPPRDLQTVNIWRAETLSALMVTQEYTDLRMNHLIRLTNHILGNLSASFPNLFGEEEAINRFYDHVTVPAATIVSKLQGLASTYRLDMLSIDFSYCKLLTKDDLKEVIAIDLETGKTLKPGSAIVSDKEGIIGHFVWPLEPSLVRVNESASDTCLRQETWLVRLDHTLGSRGHHGD